MVDKDIVDITWNKTPYLGSIFFFLFVILLTVGLFSYNYYLKQQSIEIQSKIEWYNKSIAEVEKDNSFKIYALIDANKKIIEKLTERSKITNYINHLEQVAKDYWVVFWGFNISGWKLDTSISIENDDYSLAYKKLVKFIKNYRKDKEALFKLGFITRVTWYDSIKFNLNFEIK